MDPRGRVSVADVAESAAAAAGGVSRRWCVGDVTIAVACVERALACAWTGASGAESEALVGTRVDLVEAMISGRWPWGRGQAGEIPDEYHTLFQQWLSAQLIQFVYAVHTQLTAQSLAVLEQVFSSVQEPVLAHRATEEKPERHVLAQCLENLDEGADPTCLRG